MRPNTSQEIEDALEYLGVKVGASPEEVKRRYLELVAKWHPDKHDNDRVADQAMKQINAARAVLLASGTFPGPRPQRVADPAPPDPVPDPAPSDPPPPRPGASESSSSSSSSRGDEREYPDTIAAFVDREMGRAYQACADGRVGANGDELYRALCRKWLDDVLPRVYARWRVRLCQWPMCLHPEGPPNGEDHLCEKHRRSVWSSDDDDEPLCKGETRDGMPCLNRARAGNYGFCGRHRTGAAVADAPWCRADNRDGSPCTNTAQTGNYGFCGRHRRKGG